jgi:hypothetical protein
MSNPSLKDVLALAAERGITPIVQGDKGQVPAQPARVRSYRMTTERTTESAILRACLDYLRLRGFMAWRNNTGAYSVQSGAKTRYVRYGAVGSGDIFAVLPGGRFLSVECKAVRGVPTDAQEQWIDSIRAVGGIAGVVRGVDDLDGMLKEHGVLEKK